MIVHPFPFERPADKSRELLNGIQYRFNFDNGYGASVIQPDGSYGSDLGLWEIAVTDHDGNLDYDSGITDDVIGRLTELEVARYLEMICRLEDK